MRCALFRLAPITLLLASSGASASDAEPPLRPAIYGGEATTGAQWESVVAVVTGLRLCTGVMVAPRIVLTAAHCLVDLEAGELPTVYVGPVVTVGKTVSVVEVGAHPSFCASCDEDVNDYGFVRLGEDFSPEGGFPAPVADQTTWDATMFVGAGLTLIGYGESDDADPLDPFKGTGKRRVVTTTITEFGPSGVELLAGGDGKGTCTGDSGGPAFATMPDGSVRLAGILSRGSCGKASFYGAAYPALCWLRDASGADLVPAGCGKCDCLDTEPSAGCGCRVAGAPRGLGAGWMVVLSLALFGARRRFGRSRS